MSLHERALEHGAVIANVASTGAVGLAILGAFHWINVIIATLAGVTALAYHGTQLLESKTIQRWLRRRRK